MAKKEIQRVAILGSGNQGPLIAYRCAVAGYEITLFGYTADDLDLGYQKLLFLFDTNLEEDLAKKAKNKIVTYTTDIKKCVSDADLVIEAVPEVLEIKRKVWQIAGSAMSSSALICTNSSSQPCSRMADVLPHPELAFNVNFSNPVEDDIVEVMRCRNTADQTLITAVDFLRSLKMVPIVTLKEITGYSYNRIWRAIKRESLFLVGNGYADFQDIDRAWMMDYKTDCGPFGIMDQVGLDVVRDIENLYYAESGNETDKPPAFLDEMINRNELGIKTNRGFYQYPNPAYKHPDWLKKKGKFFDDIEKKLSSMEESER